MFRPRIRRALLPRARVYQRLRTAHLERARRSTPASIIYVERSYDFDLSAAPDLDLIKAGTFKAPAVILASRLAAVEVNEPLVRQRLARTLLAVFAARLSGLLHGQRVTVLAHAIENRNPFTISTGRARGRQRFRLAVDQRMARNLTRQLDRLTFGTPAAMELYQGTLGHELRRTQTALFLELPAPCECPRGEDPVTNQVTFVGAFDERKGVRPLIEAWPLVMEADDSARLSLLGKGPLSKEVVGRAELLEHAEVVLDPARAQIHAALRSSRVLVLLSQPRPRWREQVGLPIVEGLAHGCTIVTTEQTGLATWLSEHGHTVIDSESDPQAIARAITSAIHTGPKADRVIADLPAVDGRLAADRWLFDSRKGSK